MRVTVKKLKQLISEGLDEFGTFWGDDEELHHAIAVMRPDDVAEHDYINVDTGEVVLDKGKAARTSSLHPQFEKDWQAKRDAKRKQEDEEEARLDAEDAEYERRAKAQDYDVEAAFMDAVKEYAEGYGADYDAGGEPQDIAPDAAENFLLTHPEWRKFAWISKMNRADVKDLVADYVFQELDSARK